MRGVPREALCRTFRQRGQREMTESTFTVILDCWVSRS
jgi:hypothetical protein